MKSVRFSGMSDRERDDLTVELIKEIALGVTLGSHPNIVAVRYALVYEDEVL